MRKKTLGLVKVYLKRIEDALKCIPGKQRNHRINEVGKDLSDDRVQPMGQPWLSTAWFGTDPTTALRDPPQPTQGGADGSPHIPIMSKHFWPQGAIRDFSRYPPNILQQEILQQKKSSLATFPEYSHFGPSRNAAGTTLLRER